jgi:hypothetical protein
VLSIEISLEPELQICATYQRNRTDLLYVIRSAFFGALLHGAGNKGCDEMSSSAPRLQESAIRCMFNFPLSEQLFGDSSSLPPN